MRTHGLPLRRYRMNEGDDEVTAQIVECYRDVFADQPWNEWLRCPKCLKYWGTKDRGELVANGFMHCGVDLTDYWPRQKVLADLRHEITDQSSCWLAFDGLSVVGFCWGYPIELAKLESKLGIQLSGITDRSKPVAYQDEVGVRSPYRGKGVAKSMVSHRLIDLVSFGLGFGVVRTRREPEPSQTYLWYTQKLGYKELARYPSEDGRVVLGRTFEGLNVLLDV